MTSYINNTDTKTDIFIADIDRNETFKALVSIRV